MGDTWSSTTYLASGVGGGRAYPVYLAGNGSSPAIFSNEIVFA